MLASLGSEGCGMSVPRAVNIAYMHSFACVLFKLFSLILIKQEGKSK